MAVRYRKYRYHRQIELTAFCPDIEGGVVAFANYPPAQRLRQSTMLRFKPFKLAFGMLMLAGLAFVASDQLSAIKIARLETRIGDLEREMTELKLYAERITAARRVAQVNVMEQRPGDDANGPVTVMRWQQIGSDGELGLPEIIEIRGTQAYFEALVIKFDYDLIGETDSGETNLALFKRTFGDYQAPITGYRLDQTAPTFSTATPQEYARHKNIWERFWNLTTDSELAKTLGVRVAQIEAPSVKVEPGQIWEIALDAAGGLNVKLLATDGPAVRQDVVSLNDVG